MMKAEIPIATSSICVSIDWSSTDIHDSSITVAREPGKAIHNAANSIPFAPANLLPIQPDISTGKAPGVILATITSESYSSLLTNFLLSTISCWITGISEVPPPKPIKPIFKKDKSHPAFLLFICYSAKSVKFVFYIVNNIEAF